MVYNLDALGPAACPDYKPATSQLRGVVTDLCQRCW